jgi:AcrR family transcriptional regulator
MARPLTDIEAGRTQLLELVEGLIKQRGAVSVTLAELAAAAGMSPANIYRYFEDKEALFEAVAERWFAPKIRIMEEVVESNLPIRQKLHDFFARRFVHMRDEYGRDPNLFTSYMELGHEHFDTVRGYIDLADHYLAMVVSEAMDQGNLPGLSIDEAVSLINLMVQSFCNPELLPMMVHRATEEKLGLIVDAILGGLQGKTETAVTNVVDMNERRSVA